MGACATKPKVLTGNADQAPAPEKAEEDVGVSEIAREVEIGDTQKEIEGDGDQIKEIVDDEQGSKRRSLSHLFQENEERKDITQSDTKPSEPVKEESVEIEEPSNELIMKLPEAETCVVPVEHTSKPDVPLLEKTIEEGIPPVETETIGTTEEKTEVNVSSDTPTIETETIGTSEEKTEVKVSSDTPTIETETIGTSEEKAESKVTPHETLKETTPTLETETIGTAKDKTESEVTSEETCEEKTKEVTPTEKTETIGTFEEKAESKVTPDEPLKEATKETTEPNLPSEETCVEKAKEATPIEKIETSEKPELATKEVKVNADETPEKIIEEATPIKKVEIEETYVEKKIDG